MITDFQVPKTLDDCESRREKLVMDQINIQNQIQMPERLNQNGSRMNSIDYWKWRGKATHALRCIQAELIFLKTWRRKYLQEQDNNKKQNIDLKRKELVESTPLKMMAQMKNVMSEWIELYEIQPSEEDVTLLREVRKLLRFAGFKTGD